MVTNRQTHTQSRCGSYAARGGGGADVRECGDATSQTTLSARRGPARTRHGPSAGAGALRTGSDGASQASDLTNAR